MFTRSSSGDTKWVPGGKGASGGGGGDAGIGGNEGGEGGGEGGRGGEGCGGDIGGEGGDVGGGNGGYPGAGSDGGEGGRNGGLLKTISTGAATNVNLSSTPTEIDSDATGSLPKNSVASSCRYSAVTTVIFAMMSPSVIRS